MYVVVVALVVLLFHMHMCKYSLLYMINAIQHQKDSYILEGIQYTVY
jgi:hypothetical protein